MESKLVGFIEKIRKEITKSQPENAEKHHTLIFLPVGVPGMGKTTLGRFLESASQALRVVLPDGKTHGTVNFTRVSYDHIFTELRDQHCRENPGCCTIAAFDIV